MKTAIELAAALSARYLDTKQMLPDELAHEAAAMILQQTKQIDALKADAERFTTLAEYLVSDRTDCDDAIVATKTVKQLRAAIDAMKGKS